MAKQILLYIKHTDETIARGIAGHRVIRTESKVWEDGVLHLNVYVRDMDGGLAGPYKIKNDETETRDLVAESAFKVRK